MKTKIKKKLKENAIGYGLLLPFLIGLIGFTVYPLGLALVQSFYKDYSPVTGYDPSALGIDNYVRALTDEWVLRSIKLTLVYAAITIPIGLIVSFFIAYLLTAPIKCSKLFRVLVYLPALIPGIVGASIYKYMFGPDEFGLFNQILIAMGQEPSQLLESKNQTIAVLCFFLTGIFSYGCTTPMWIAGLKTIPSDVYEAAAIDGSSRLQTLFKITLPLMGKFIFLQLLGSLIGTLQIGESVLMLSSRGGFNGNLNFYGLMIYNQTTDGIGNYGFASALSYLLFIVIAALSAITFKANKKVYYEDA